MAEQSDIKTISISVTADTSKAKSNLNELASKLGEVKGKVQQLGAPVTGTMQSVNTAFAKTTSGVNMLNMALGNLKTYNLTQWGQAQQALFATTAKMNMVSSALKALGNPIQMLTTPLKMLWSVLKGVGGAFLSLEGSIKKGGVAIGKLIGKIAIAPFRNLAMSIKDVTKRLGGFFSAMKRIAVYRAIRFFLKELTKAFKEGIENLYQYSKLIDGQFARSMDMLATSALYAKNSLAAMVAPIINQVAPAIDMLVDKMVDGMNKINELIASFTGASTWTAALKYPKEYAESLDDATGSAKKLRATLLGFDEINRLDDNNKGSRGRAGDQLDYSKMFEERIVDTKAKGFVEQIKNAFLSGDMESIGTQIGEKIKKGLDSIPWDRIKQNVSRNARSLATLINGFVTTEGLADSIGTTIAEALNTVVTKTDVFFSEVKWEDVGNFVGDSINTAIEKFDFTKLGRTISNIIEGALKFAKTLMIRIDWKSVGKKIGEFLNGIDWGEVISDLGETLSGVISGAIDAAWELIKESPVAGTIAVALVGLRLGNLLGANIASGVASSGLTGKIASLIPTAATIAITAVVGYKVGNKIFESFGDDMKDSLAEVMGEWDNFVNECLGIETEAYHNIANAWQPAKDAASKYYALVEQGESQKQFLMKMGYSADTAARAVQLTEMLRLKEEAADRLEAMGLQTSELQKQADKEKLLRKYSDEEIAAWLAIKRESFKINWELNFGWSWDDVIKKVKSGFDKTKGKFESTLNSIGKTLGDFFGSAFGSAVKSSSASTVGTPVASTASKIKNVTTKMAGGGYAESGSVFIAGERGAEIVASHGGHTQVANRDQIANSVAIGMEAANEDTLAELRKQNELLQIIASKDFSPVTTISTDTITNALNRQNRRVGATVIPVGG